MQATLQQGLYWECSTCSTTSGLSLDGCDVRFVDRESFEGADANMVFIGDDEACLQLMYESGQRPENQVVVFGLVSRQKVESGE